MFPRHPVVIHDLRVPSVEVVPQVARILVQLYLLVVGNEWQLLPVAGCN